MLFVRSFVHDEEQKNMTIVVVQNKKICNRSQISESILFFIVIYGIIIMPDCPKRVEEALFFNQYQFHQQKFFQIGICYAVPLFYHKHNPTLLLVCQ